LLNVSNAAHGAYPNVFKNLPSDKLRNRLDVAIKTASELSGTHNLMSADTRNTAHFRRDGSLAEALYFDSGNHRLFGWLHHPTEGTTSSVGLVICKPFGYESVCAHRSTRAFAEAAAAVGVPSLRFDYLGTGDSADIGPLADQLDVWTHDVVAAVEELQRRTGVERICLLGIRLGALLATLAASHCKTVKSLILIAPVISGPRYLRELRMVRLAASLGADPEDSASGAPSDLKSPTRSMEVSGFMLSAATVAALAKVELTTLSASPTSEILVIDGVNLTRSRDWTEVLSGLGVRTKYLALRGLVEMIMTAPQFAVIPQEMIDAVRDWLLGYHRGPSVQSESRRQRTLDYSSSPEASVLHLPSDAAVSNALLTERPALFGADAVLFGIVTEPPSGELCRGSVILLNAGADYHTGPCRMYVSMARRWARRGYVVLRMDLAGLGDSATSPGKPDNDLFPPAALDDIRTAIEFVRDRYGSGEITLGGLCNGAYHALRAAAAAMPVNRIFLINPQNYFWTEGTPIDEVQVAEVVRNPGVYRERVLSARAWKRLVSGQVNIRRIVKIYIHRSVLALDSIFRDLARRLGVHLSNDLGRELEQITARGVRVLFVFARGEPGIELLKLQGGSSVRRLGERCRVHVIDGADHVFTQSGTRAVLEQILTDELNTRDAWSAASPRLELQQSH
jgi:pimeloyl-ACP methyl ester carboxylesterase